MFPLVEEIGGNFEGDIILTPEQEQQLFGYGRTGLIDLRYRWPGNSVPYSLSSVFDPGQRAYIELGLRRLESVTCLRFVPRTNQTNYVQVTVSIHPRICIFTFSHFSVIIKGHQ